MGETQEPEVKEKSSLQKVREYIRTPKELRMDKQKFLALNNIKEGTFYTFQTRIKREEKRLGIKNGTVNPEEMVVDDGYDTVTYLNQRAREADAALMAAVRKGNAMALKMYYYIVGKYKEGDNDKGGSKLTADDIYRIRNQVQGSGKPELPPAGGDREVQPRPDLLPTDVLLYPKQHDQPDNPVG